ncbi:MAG: aminotransferase class IV [Pseudoruegeria sp.]
MIAYLDGNFITPDQASILSVHALHYASAVFEGIRIYDGQAFMLTAHVERLLQSAEIIGLKPNLTLASCTSILTETIERSGLRNAYLRPIIFQGGPNLGVYAPDNVTRFGALIWEWPSVFGEQRAQTGISLTTDVPYRRAPELCFPSQAKSSAGYMVSGINRRKAELAGFDDALMLTHAGLIAEASGANIFMVHNGELLTPEPHGILNGITRQVVMANLPDGLICRECPLDPSDILEAEEVFLTGTAYEVIPVRQIDNTLFQVGPRTQQIMDIYRSLTSVIQSKR